MDAGPVGDLQYAPVTVDLPRESAYALENRADLKLLRALVDATAADRQSVQAGYFPFVSLVGSALLIPQDYLLTRQTQIVVGQQTESTEGRAGVAMSWQVIDNGQVTGASRRIEATRQIYEVTLHKLEQNVPRELATVEGSLQNADARHAALAKSAAEAEENLTLIETQDRARPGHTTGFPERPEQPALRARRPRRRDVLPRGRAGRVGPRHGPLPAISFRRCPMTTLVLPRGHD